LPTSNDITFVSVVEIIPAVPELKYANNRMVRPRDISCLYAYTVCKWQSITAECWHLELWGLLSQLYSCSQCYCHSDTAKNAKHSRKVSRCFM